ncbi:MAG: M14 family zinc carboxypeptidase, partial [Ignavibacteria bacterium]
MKKFNLLLILSSFSFHINSQTLLTPYEKDKTTTTTYQECIDYYFELAKRYDMVKIIEYGETDIGKPLHLVVISKDEIFEPAEIRKSGKIILLVNNGIHAGEPDGIDASMMLVRDIVTGRVKNPVSGLKYDNVLDNVVLIIIPIYSIGGVMNRNNFTRANQVGPKEYGFRGNSQNRDLNRDFIKCDSKNAVAFIKIFQEWLPELFVDTHTTDGADYPYKMTYIAPLHDKSEPLASYMKNDLLSFLENDMKKKNFEMCPYVYLLKSTPDTGIVEFPETPRYSTGYSSLFNSIGFVSESHMLKTHQERVEATYEFLVSLLMIANSDFKKIKANKIEADENTSKKNEFALRWQLDSAYYAKYSFSGYEAKYKKSSVTGFDKLYYDRSLSYEKEINFYNRYLPAVTITKPIAYIVPQGWWQVVER